MFLRRHSESILTTLEYFSEPFTFDAEPFHGLLRDATLGTLALTDNAPFQNNPYSPVDVL